MCKGADEICWRMHNAHYTAQLTEQTVLSVKYFNNQASAAEFTQVLPRVPRQQSYRSVGLWSEAHHREDGTEKKLKATIKYIFNYSVAKKKTQSCMFYQLHSASVELFGLIKR